MGANGPISGKFGALNGISCVRRWSITDLMEIRRVVASNTGGGSGRSKGLQDWNGSFDVYGGHPEVLPGSIFAFSGYVGPDDGVQGSNGLVYSGNALLTQLTINWDFVGSTPINCSGTFGGSGILSSAQAAPITDTTPVPDFDTCQLKFEIGPESSEQLWKNITTASLTLQCDEQVVANSSSNCWKLRRGGPKDWTLSVNLESEDRTQLSEMPTKGSQVRIKAYTSSEAFWLLEWGRVRDYTNIQVDIESGAVVGCTCNIEMDIVNESDGSLGRVVAPGGSVHWYGTSP